MTDLSLPKYYICHHRCVGKRGWLLKPGGFIIHWNGERVSRGEEWLVLVIEMKGMNCNLLNIFRNPYSLKEREPNQKMGEEGRRGESESNRLHICTASRYIVSIETDRGWNEK